METYHEKFSSFIPRVLVQVRPRLSRHIQGVYEYGSGLGIKICKDIEVPADRSAVKDLISTVLSTAIEPRTGISDQGLEGIKHTTNDQGIFKVQNILISAVLIAAVAGVAWSLRTRL